MSHQTNTFSIIALIFICASIFSSCNKNQDAEPTTAITVLGSDFAKARRANSISTYKTLNNLQITTAPTEGENQVWDLTSYKTTTATQLTDNDLAVPAGTSFTSANFIQTQPSTFIPVFTYSDFFEVSESGFFAVGNKVQPAEAQLGNGIVLSSIGKENPWTPKQLLMKFPITYKDVATNESILREEYSLTVPAFGLTNAPVERKITITRKIETLGWGEIILPSDAISETAEVLLIKVTESQLNNYFLNGTTAPPTLLNALGLIEGETSSLISYRFLSKEFGYLSTFIFDVNTDGSIKYPATGAIYTVSR